MAKWQSLANWKREIVVRLNSMSNAELLETALFEANYAGSDQASDRDHKSAQLARIVLLIRLVQDGFIPYAEIDWIP